jgi:hypothetical protein
MKTTIAAMTALIAALFVLSPIAAAAGTVTVATDKSSYTGAAPITITVTATPAPGAGNNVAITVFNPNGQAVASSPADISSGTATFAFTTGGSAAWISGTYTITAAVPSYTAGSGSFSYTAIMPSSFNETRALLNIQGNLTIIQKEITNLNHDLNGNVTAIKATQTSQGTIISGLQTSLATLTSSVNSLQGSVSGLVTTVGSIQTTVNGLGTTISAAASAVQSATNAVNNSQTYLYVVIALVAITLVLELAIMVRKLS